MKQTLLLTCLLLGATAQAQITIDMNDMPVANDTFRFSLSDNQLDIIDLGDTGPDYVWDYSHLSSTSQRLDTFVNPVFGTPLFYNVTFSNIFDQDHFADVATRNLLSSQVGFGPIALTDVYDYFQTNATYFANVGMGATINAVPLTSTMEPRDFIYRFPLTYPNTDESFSQYGFEIPTLGYYGQKKNRANEVDGWGTLKTRYGTFQALRIYSALDVTDTVSFNGFGFDQQQPPQFEVKWLAKGIHAPLLKVTGRNNMGQVMIMSVEYLDSIRGFTPGSGVGVDEAMAQSTVSIWPNPATDQVRISTSHSAVNPFIRLYDATGREVFSTTVKSAATEFVLELPATLVGGAYTLRVGASAPVRLMVVR